MRGNTGKKKNQSEKQNFWVNDYNFRICKHNQNYFHGIFYTGGKEKSVIEKE